MNALSLLNYLVSDHQPIDLGEWVPMEKTILIMRKSIHSFLRNYQFFTTKAAILALPFSSSFLLSQVIMIVPSCCPSLFSVIFNQLTTLFQAAGFPPSQFFSFLSLKISQTLASSITVVPFTVTSLIAAKALVINCLNNHKPPSSFTSAMSLYIPILKTSVCNTLLLLSANSTAFSILFFVSSLLQAFRADCSSGSALFLSVTGACLYSIILAHTLVVCNLATAVSGMGKSDGGFTAVLKACELIRGRTSTALSLAVAVNLLLAAVEALFHYRIVRPFRDYEPPERARLAITLEAVLIAYLYSIFLVLETVVSYRFFKCCMANRLTDDQTGYDHRIEIAEDETSACFKIEASRSN